MSGHCNPALHQPKDLTVAGVAARMASYQPRIDELWRRYPTKRAVLLQVLWLAQQEFGWVPRVAIEWAAEVAGCSPVQAFSVVEFYTMYRQVPVGRHLVQVCQTMCCHQQGSEDLIAHLEKTLGVHASDPAHHTTADGLFTLVRVECLALCGTGPGVMIDDQAIGPKPFPLGTGDLYEHYFEAGDFHPTPKLLDEWIAFLRAEAAKNPHPKQQHCAIGDLKLDTKGHPAGFQSAAKPLPAGYSPAPPALKVAAAVNGPAVALTWINDPGCTKIVVERSDDAGATWRDLATPTPKDQKASDTLAEGQTAHYRVVAHEKDRVAKPSAVVSATGKAPAPPAPAPVAGAKA
jgi:NADH:ubiquinone oxidoreductase subunit E